MKPMSLYRLFSLRLQRGLSLIELMVAMVIGSILILGVTQIFISNQKSYLFQQGQMGNQENGRFALAMLNQELNKAGYRSNPARPFPAAAGLGCTFKAETSVYAIDKTAMCIQYQASNRSDTSCVGAALSGATQALIAKPYNRTSDNPVIIEKIAFDAATNTITCTVGTTTLPLVSGVADVRFDYGSGAERSVSTYGTSNPGDPIGAVRYAILLQSEGTSSIRDTTATSTVLTDWNTRYQANLNETKKIYQIVQGTTMIRNQMQ